MVPCLPPAPGPLKEPEKKHLSMAHPHSLSLNNTWLLLYGLEVMSLAVLNLSYFRGFATGYIHCSMMISKHKQKPLQRITCRSHTSRKVPNLDKGRPDKKMGEVGQKEKKRKKRRKNGFKMGFHKV